MLYDTWTDSLVDEIVSDSQEVSLDEMLRLNLKSYDVLFVTDDQVFSVKGHEYIPLFNEKLFLELTSELKNKKDFLDMIDNVKKFDWDGVESEVLPKKLLIKKLFR